MSFILRFAGTIAFASGLFASGGAIAAPPGFPVTGGAACDQNRPCGSGEFCLLPDGVCDPAGSGQCQPIPGNCFDPVDPVCGCDGSSYDNRCLALVAEVNVATPGSCQGICGGPAGLTCESGELCKIPPGMCSIADPEGECTPIPADCPPPSDPVCGCDGVTYGNACLADQAEVPIDHVGRCVTVCSGSTGEPCDAVELCVLPDGVCDQPEALGTCEPAPLQCFDPVDPICGCDGLTYDNRCEAQLAGTMVDTPGPCSQICGGPQGIACGLGDFCKIPSGSCNDAQPLGICEAFPETCPSVEDPVCGCNGVTYPNECEADVAGVAVDRPGLCNPPCVFGEFACGEDEFCRIPEGACEQGNMGVCVVIPPNCPGDSSPVCGCDGTTYASQCEAESAGTQVNRDGTCGQTCGGEAGTMCAGAEFCLLGDGLCDNPVAEGECVAAPNSCPGTVDPVCGCDGKTYGNRCLARAAEVQIATDGACDRICGGAGGLTCEPGEFCIQPLGVCDLAGTSGTCESLPGVCPETCHPVCGCDGVTRANACFARADGISIDHAGDCDPGGRLIKEIAFDGPTVMTWQPAPQATAYNVYREILDTLPPVDAGVCFVAHQVEPTAEVPEIPPPGVTWLFQVTGLFPEGEGPMGISTDCQVRAPREVCAIP